MTTAGKSGLSRDADPGSAVKRRIPEKNALEKSF
jgi:hypothetical protein